ncbi:MAG TPA: nucleoid-associated protein [Providencia sp.]|uniref:nucleoid-associated protein n=1 Tax=Providencia sp. TaxID=589 RepID=UPI000E8B3114|nr:nucleoid-associated protein [Providencia sp.]
MTDKSINVSHVVVHILHKEQHESPLIELSPTETSVTKSSKRLISDIRSKYSSRASKGYGSFVGDVDNYPMESMINDYINNTLDFYKTTCRMMDHLLSRAVDEPLSTGGYVLFSHVNTDENEYILVAIVNSRTGSAINASFDIEDSVYLDISNLKVAGRIDLTSLNNGSDRYISFLKGQSNISNYFKKFLGCNDVMIAKRETEKLSDALKSFADEMKLSKEDRDRFFEKSHEHLKDLNQKQLPINLESFANAVWPDAPEKLIHKLSDENLEISDGFIPDAATIKGLVSFKGKTSHWEIKFDRAGLLDDSIVFNEKRNELILRNIPESLRLELIKEVKSD